jgi:hypothetical protein
MLKFYHLTVKLPFGLDLGLTDVLVSWVGPTLGLENGDMILDLPGVCPTPGLCHNNNHKHKEIASQTWIA